MENAQQAGIPIIDLNQFINPATKADFVASIDPVFLNIGLK